MNKLLIAPALVTTAVFGAMLFFSGRIASGDGSKPERSPVEITNADSLSRNVGESVTFTGIAQQRRSGPWLRRGPLAVQILGIQKWPEDLRIGAVAVTGMLAKRSGHEQGNVWFAIEAKKVTPARPPASSTRPATRPSDEIFPVSTYKDLERHNGDHVRVLGILENRKAGPHLRCGEFSVQLLIKERPNAELSRALYSDTPVWIEADGWVRDLHFRNPSDGKKLEPGMAMAANIRSGDWRAIDDVEWKIVAPLHDPH